MSVYFISDLHLGSNRTANKRDFDSVKEHDTSIIEGINSTVHKKAILWILGDIASNREALFLLKDVKCRKKAVLGNHDELAISDYSDVFESIHGAASYKKMWLTHIPIHKQELLLHLTPGIKANLHGHIHKNSATSNLPLPYINVNYDFVKIPVNIDQIKNTVALYHDMCKAESYARVNYSNLLQEVSITYRGKKLKKLKLTEIVPGIITAEPLMISSNTMTFDDGSILKV